MDNRINNQNDNQKERIQEELKRRLDAIMNHAAMIYDLLEPGMTIIVRLEETPNLIIPNQAPKVKHLYITRPAMMLEVKG